MKLTKVNVQIAISFNKKFYQNLKSWKMVDFIFSSSNISQLISYYLTLLRNDIKRVKDVQNVEAFSEYLNFDKQSQQDSQKINVTRWRFSFSKIRQRWQSLTKIV